ncbi:MAG: fructosamine kinase family protein [Azospirillaceae bacterium]
MTTRPGMTARPAGGDPLLARVSAALGVEARASRPLAGASTVRVERVDLADGRRVVAKFADGRGRADLPLEAFMLSELTRESALPVPEVLHSADDLLVLTHIDNDGRGPNAEAQRHAADLLAALHGRAYDTYGYSRDTVIGQLHQPNPRTGRWVDFFRDHRLLHMTLEGHREGTVSDRLRDRLEALAGRIERYIDEPTHPALLHGDLWTGNVLCQGGRVAGLIDPAIYIGHPEIELAFTTLFGTFDRPFFERYAERAPFAPDFFELRRDLYNIYPLLVHVRYWDESYARPIERTLSRLGL